MTEYKTPLIITHKKLIFLLKKLNPKNRKNLINQLTKKQIDCISEIFSNFLKKHLSVSPKIIKKLRRYQEEIRSLARKKTPGKLKKDILTSRRGGNILSVILPIVSSLFSNLIG